MVSFSKEECLSVDRTQMSVELDSSPFTTLLQGKNSGINRAFSTLFFFGFLLCLSPKIQSKKIQLMKSYSAAPIICGLTNQSLDLKQNDYTKHQVLPRVPAAPCLFLRIPTIEAPAFQPFRPHPPPKKKIFTTFPT